MTDVRKFLPLTMLPALMLWAGCGPKQFLNQNDELRRHNLALTHEIWDLRAKADARAEQIESLQERLRGLSTTIEGADPPRLVKLRFGRYSGAINSDGTGRIDLVRVYLRTLDQHGRFMPVAGRAVIRVVRLDPDTPPQTLAERAYEPAEFDQAYRSGITGTHYTLQLELPTPLPEGLDRAGVDVLVWDAASGIRHRETAIMPIRTAARDTRRAMNTPPEAPRKLPSEPTP